MAFYLVYIREAHALDSAMPMPFGLVEDPTTAAERAELAGTCVDDLELPMPALVDGVDDLVGRAYAGWPDRLYVIGVDGRIAYASGPGPSGFLPDDWAAAIAAELAKARPTGPNGQPAGQPAEQPGSGKGALGK